MGFRLQRPVASGKIIQGFGENPEYYKQWGLPGHDGIDFEAPEGTPVYACADGIVKEVRIQPEERPHGKQVYIQHEDDFKTGYAHLSAVHVKQDQHVKAGDILGEVGSTDPASGRPHLHLTLMKDGATRQGETHFPNDIIDPAIYLETSGDALKEQTAQTKEAAAETIAEERIRYEIAGLALSDRAVQTLDNDLLGFKIYAQALAEFILHRRTGKPLTIAIDAPWGMGKTSLMYMIREQAISRVREERAASEIRLVRSLKKLWWRIRPSNDLLVGSSLPTVWFNAWKYDQEEALWAALALAVIDQIGAQLGFFKRLRFKVRLRGFDVQGLLRDMRDTVIYAAIITLLGTAVAVITLQWFGNSLSQALETTIQAIPLSAGGLVVFFRLGKSVHDGLTKLFNLNIDKYTRQQPNYRERLGFIAEFESDFKRLVRVVTERGKYPLIIFIDDLDRCAVPKVAEIVEAINVFLDAEHCVFVIGMDGRTVAASIEVRYEKLKAHLEEQDPGALSLGRYFLEKIVQINFHIPRLDENQLKTFVAANLVKTEGEEKQDETPAESEVGEAAQRIEERVEEEGTKQSVEQVRQARLKAQSESPDIAETAFKEAERRVIARQFDDLAEVEDAVAGIVRYLDYNPRRVKRFMNAFRLQALIANRRDLLSDRTIELDMLAIWLLIAMRWPAFVGRMIIDKDFDDNLQTLYALQEEVKDEALAPDVRKQKEEALKRRQVDPLTTKLLAANELSELLEQITPLDDSKVGRYLVLANIVGNMPPEVEKRT